jgi:hypothetical protein
MIEHILKLAQDQEKIEYAVLLLFDLKNISVRVNITSKMARIKTILDQGWIS